ncbi:hypothetical protein GWI33_011498 [Rhynchophorus ferrugineus]|uniref:Uncharacterized protein n=1 Tax=Rhynchophorus ferrugineus TaxID=354439 RepID=A0A834I9M4_RHYFE|nr:hypothetical protein GWI33_011498 [Rhynchophorus ferrugineus]
MRPKTDKESESVARIPTERTTSPAPSSFLIGQRVALRDIHCDGLTGRQRRGFLSVANRLLSCEMSIIDILATHLPDEINSRHLSTGETNMSADDGNQIYDLLKRKREPNAVIPGHFCSVLAKYIQ